MLTRRELAIAILSFLSALLLVGGQPGASFSSSPAPGWVEAYFTSQIRGDCQAASANLNPACVLLRHIQGAERKILMAMYESEETSNDPLGNALRLQLLQALKTFNGFLRVRLGQNNRLYEDQPSPRLADYLSEGPGDRRVCTGDIRFPGHESGRVHHKFLVIDDEVVITGSLNWNGSSIEDNAENIVVIVSEEIAQAFTQELRRIWDCGRPDF